MRNSQCDFYSKTELIYKKTYTLCCHESFIVLELKAREFDPKGISQLNFYMSAVDDHLRSAGDEPTIGMIFCKTKQNFTVEYALRDFNKPIGVAGYEITLVEALSKELKESLPTIEDIEAEFGKEELDKKNKPNRETAVSLLDS